MGNRPSENILNIFVIHFNNILLILGILITISIIYNIIKFYKNKNNKDKQKITKKIILGSMLCIAVLLILIFLYFWFYTRPNNIKNYCGSFIPDRSCGFDLNDEECARMLLFNNPNNKFSKNYFNCLKNKGL
jgi:hypothetical protein